MAVSWVENLHGEENAREEWEKRRTDVAIKKGLLGSRKARGIWGYECLQRFGLQRFFPLGRKGEKTFKRGKQGGEPAPFKLFWSRESEGRMEPWA